MKKLISLSVVISMFSFGAFAQDTSLNRPTVPPNNMDTVPDTKKWSSKDSSKMDFNKDSTLNKQWPDTTSDSRKNWNKDSLSTQRTMDTSAANTTLTTDSASTSSTNTTDSMRNREAAKEDWKMKKDQQDSMSTNTSAQAAGGTDSLKTTAVVSDRILMRNDSTLIMKDGEAVALDKEYTLPSGAVVMTNGTVKYPSGKTVQLKNGQFIALAAEEEKADKADKPSKKAGKLKKKSKS